MLKIKQKEFSMEELIQFFEKEILNKQTNLKSIDLDWLTFF